jgi:hypothetical protein
VSAPVKKFLDDAKNAFVGEITAEDPFPEPALGKREEFIPLKAGATTGHGSSLSVQLSASGTAVVVRQTMPGKYTSSK